MKTDPYRRITSLIRWMKPIIAKRNWNELEQKYRKECADLAGSQASRAIAAVSVQEYQERLSELFARATYEALLYKFDRVYFEFDLDNNWSGYLAVGKREFVRLPVPNFPAFGKFYGDGFAENLNCVGRNAFLIARTYAAIGRAIDSIDTAGLRFEACFHDQEEPIVFAVGATPNFARITEQDRNRELSDVSNKRTEKLLEDLNKYLISDEQRKGIAVIATVGGMAGVYGAELPKSGGIDYVYLENTPATDADISWLRFFPTLVQVTLCGTNISDEGLNAISTLINLNSLFLDNTQISDVGLAKLTGLKSLRTLTLSKTRVSSAGARFLAEMKSLENLSVHGIEFSNDAKAMLLQKVPSIKISPELGHEELRERLRKWMLRHS